MEYKKPQATIIQGNVGIYPLTTADQVILADGTRLEKDGKINVDVANSADSAKLGGKAPEYYIQPRNLLDNSDFRNPVNQREKTSYSGIWVYNIDRWAAWFNASNPATVTIDSGGITPYPGMIIQRIESKYIDSSKTYTLAAMTGDGLLVLSGKITSATQSTTNSNNGISFEYNAESDTYQFVLYSSTSASKFVWAALYEGSYTADTLPPYVPKGYAAELAECQRYYYQSWTDSSPNTFNGVIICEAIVLSRATNVVFPQTMRISNPTVTLYSPATGNTGKASEFVSNTEIDAGSVYLSRNGFTLGNTASAFEIGKHYCIHYSVSADL